MEIPLKHIAKLGETLARGGLGSTEKLMDSYSKMCKKCFPGLSQGAKKRLEAALGQDIRFADLFV